MPNVTAFTLPPDWVCEVLSPFIERLDREEKRPAYARGGVRHLWLVDPIRQSLEVYRLEAGRWAQAGYHQGPVRIRAEPFEALELGLGWLARPPPPRLARRRGGNLDSRRRRIYLGGTRRGALSWSLQHAATPD